MCAEEGQTFSASAPPPSGGQFATCTLLYLFSMRRTIVLAQKRLGSQLVDSAWWASMSVFSRCTVAVASSLKKRTAALLRGAGGSALGCYGAATA